MITYYTTGDGLRYQTPDGTYLVLYSPDSLGLITDRTAADVARWRELHDKGWSAMTAAERTEWSGEMKGRYSYTDMNRVESVVDALSQRLFEKGYLDTPLSVKTDWDVWDVPTVTDMRRYLNNISVLRGLVTVYPTTPEAPTIHQPFDYERANDIEQILIDVDNSLTAIPQSWIYAGEIKSGEV